MTMDFIIMALLPTMAVIMNFIFIFDLDNGFHYQNG
jgi:hypothetical protein